MTCGAGLTVRNGSLEQAMHPHVTPEQTPQPSPQRDAQPLEAPLEPSKGASQAQPFDMWAAQNGSAQASEKARPFALTPTHWVMSARRLCVSPSAS